MKLRNKKTGEIIKSFDSYFWDDRYSSLAELNEEWEDYTPKEPLIKDEKIRKAVRAWAELLLTNEIHVARYDCMTVFRDEKTGYRLEIVTDDIQHGSYTIAELCGEEE